MVVLLTRQRVAGQFFKDRNLATGHGCCATGRQRGRHRGPLGLGPWWNSVGRLISLVGNVGKRCAWMALVLHAARERLCSCFK
jgi:hypothetical protein